MSIEGPHGNNPPTGRNLVVTHLPESVDNAILRSLFIEFGLLESARVMYHRQSKKTRGFGFVKFFSDADAVLAQRKMNRYVLQDKRLRVEFAKSQGDIGGRESVSSDGLSECQPQPMLHGGSGVPNTVRSESSKPPPILSETVQPPRIRVHQPYATSPIAQDSSIILSLRPVDKLPSRRPMDGVGAPQYRGSPHEPLHFLVYNRHGHILYSQKGIPPPDNLHMLCDLGQHHHHHPMSQPLQYIVVDQRGNTIYNRFDQLPPPDLCYIDPILIRYSSH